MKKGIVYLVGAGPGDPSLITLKGVESLRRAEVVVYDYLANERLLQFVGPKAETVYVGKKGSHHALEQEGINSLLVEKALRGKVVVRLKGGDPFVFGRGGEEAEALHKAGIPFEIVPGVTSAIAVPAYAGIPITHRDYTSTVAFVTGHEKEGVGNIEWPSLSKIGTLVFLMGAGNLPQITKNLIENGRDPETPIAVIEWGTLPRQKSVVGTLRTIHQEVSGINPPVITVVGSVVSLRPVLSWFEGKPLFGKTILVTRTRGQASELSRGLEENGAEVIEIPTILQKPPTSWRYLDRSIGSLEKYQWLIFTSVNGVDSFFSRLREKGRDLRDLKGLKIAAVGPATARAVEEKGIRVDSVAAEYQAEGLVKVFSRKRVKGQRILIPRAREAREILVTELRRLGARVDEVEAYRMVLPREGILQLGERIESGRLDLITFASSSTVENFVKMAGRNLEKVRKIPVASIGPITSNTAKKHQLNLVIQPKSYTIPALVRAIVEYYSK